MIALNNLCFHLLGANDPKKLKIPKDAFPFD